MFLPYYKTRFVRFRIVKANGKWVYSVNQKALIWEGDFHRVPIPATLDSGWIEAEWTVRTREASFRSRRFSTNKRPSVTRPLATSTFVSASVSVAYGKPLILKEGGNVVRNFRFEGKAERRTYLYSTLSSNSRLRTSWARFLTASSLSSSSGGRETRAKPYCEANGLSLTKAGGRDASREVGTVCQRQRRNQYFNLFFSIESSSFWKDCANRIWLGSKLYPQSDWPPTSPLPGRRRYARWSSQKNIARHLAATKTDEKRRERATLAPQRF